MAYCGPKGIPLSTFLSWPDEDQQAALGWQAYEARRCMSCGSHPEDFTREGSERHFHKRTCLGCMRRKSVADSVGDDPAVHVEGAFGSAADCAICSPPT